MGHFWALVVTQAISFLIFFSILKYFAWGPVSRFIEYRRTEIRGQFDEAAKLQQEIDAEKAVLDERLRHAEEEARKQVQEMIAQGRQMADDITTQAQEEARGIRAHAEQVADIEYAKAMKQVKESVINMTIDATGRLLQEELTDTRHREFVARRLEELEARN